MISLIILVARYAKGRENCKLVLSTINDCVPGPVLLVSKGNLTYDEGEASCWRRILIGQRRELWLLTRTRSIDASKQKKFEQALLDKYSPPRSQI